MQRRVLPLFDLAQGPALLAILVDVGKQDRLSRAGRLAGGQDFAIDNRPALILGVNFRTANPLHAVAALLHDAAGSDRYVGIVLLPQARRGVIRIMEEIETPHL